MRRILIVGAGQAGLQLALCLQAEGYDVTVMSARTPEEIRGGRIMSTQCIFWPQLQIERDHGLNLWEDRSPRIVAQRVTVAGPPGNRAFQTLGRWTTTRSRSTSGSRWRAGWSCSRSAAATRSTTA
ncbi:hypothetical protein [Actinomadura sp. WMMB 499]|uniref:hypothetical protein n=1 Tax=Actinomadura sp. WMMB 499 TaxID=1219491 RepID=UPI0020C78575|nr:hypothetical protein [Actinomadura sp. WMMB 499]